jgi:hypothetical protein
VATNRWRGDAPAVKQVVTLTVGSSTAGHTFITVINGKSYTVTANGTDTTAQLAAAVQALLAASTEPEFLEVAWTVSTNVVTGTAQTAGKPFTVATTGSTGTYTLATPTASSGPNHVDVAANWSLGAVPGVGDDVLIDGGSDLLYFGTLAAAAYASWRAKASFAGKIGLPRLNSAGYVEYRPRAWPLATAVPAVIGEGDGSGPVLVNITSGLALDLTVHTTGTRQDPAVPVVNVSGCTSGTLSAASGDVGLAADDDTLTATVTTANLTENVTLTVGQNATVTTLNLDGGTLVGFGTVTTLNQTAGTGTLYKAPTTITSDGGKLYPRFTGTVTTVTARGQGNRATDPDIDFSLDRRPRTLTDHSFTGGARLYDPDKTTVWTNAGTWDAASLAVSDLGRRFTLQRT